MRGNQIWSAAIVLIVCALSAWAALNGDIEGFVTDSSGAFVPGVSISITSLETGAQRYLFTDDRGHFAATLLPIGDYEVRAELAGFKPALKRLVVKSAEQARLNLTLKVGNPTQAVTAVDTTVQFVKTTAAQVHAAIEP